MGVEGGGGGARIRSRSSVMVPFVFVHTIGRTFSCSSFYHRCFGKTSRNFAPEFREKAWEEDVANWTNLCGFLRMQKRNESLQLNRNLTQIPIECIGFSITSQEMLLARYA